MSGDNNTTHQGKPPPPMTPPAPGARPGPGAWRQSEGSASGPRCSWARRSGWPLWGADWPPPTRRPCRARVCRRRSPGCRGAPVDEEGRLDRPVMVLRAFPRFLGMPMRFRTRWACWGSTGKTRALWRRCHRRMRSRQVHAPCPMLWRATPATRGAPCVGRMIGGNSL